MCIQAKFLCASLTAALLAGCTQPEADDSIITESLPAKTPPSPPAPRCVESPASTGGDDTIALNAWLASVPDGGVACFKANAHYIVERTLRLDHRNNFTLLGQGAEIEATSIAGDLDPSGKLDAREHILIVGGSAITIADLSITSAGTCAFDQLNEGEAAVLVQGTQGLVLRNLTVTGVAGDVLEVQREDIPNSGGQFIEPRNVSLTHSSASCIGRHGYSMTGSATNIVVENNVFHSVARSVMVCEMTRATDALHDVFFRSNTVGTYGNLFVGCGSLGQRFNIHVENNVLTGSPLRMKVGSPNGITDEFGFFVVGNVSQAPYALSGAAFAFLGANGVTITGNTQPFSPAVNTTAISVTDVVNLTVGGNTFTGVDTVCVGC
jgi:hypothetical protein